MHFSTRSAATGSVAPAVVRDRPHASPRAASHGSPRSSVAEATPPRAGVHHPLGLLREGDEVGRRAAQKRLNSSLRRRSQGARARARVPQRPREGSASRELAAVSAPRAAAVAASASRRRVASDDAAAASAAAAVAALGDAGDDGCPPPAVAAVADDAPAVPPPRSRASAA